MYVGLYQVSWKAPVLGREGVRRGFTTSRTRWPALCRVWRYGALLPIEAMKRRRRGVVMVGVGVGVGVSGSVLGVWDIDGFQCCRVTCSA